MMRYRLMVLFLGFLLCSCAGKVGVSYVGPLPEQPAVERIAADAVDRLAAVYPPGHTNLRLLGPQTADNFSASFENGLRKKGFTISPTGTERVTWIFDELRPAKTGWYLRLKTESRTLSRTYGANGNPAAGWAEMTE